MKLVSYYETWIFILPEHIADIVQSFWQELDPIVQHDCTGMLIWPYGKVYAMKQESTRHWCLKTDENRIYSKYGTP